MIDRAKLEMFVKNMEGNKYLATIYLIKRVTELQERAQKLIPGSQRLLVEQSIEEFLEGKSEVSFKTEICEEPKIVTPNAVEEKPKA